MKARLLFDGNKGQFGTFVNKKKAGTEEGYYNIYYKRMATNVWDALFPKIKKINNVHIDDIYEMTPDSVVADTPISFMLILSDTDSSLLNSSIRSQDKATIQQLRSQIDRLKFSNTVNKQELETANQDSSQIIARERELRQGNRGGGAIESPIHPSDRFRRTMDFDNMMGGGQD